MAVKSMMDIIARFIPCWFRDAKFERKNRISKTYCVGGTFKQLAFSIIGLFLFNFAIAQTSWQTAPALKDTSVFFVKQANGLSAVLHLQANSPNIILSYNVKIGSVYENDSISGISYILQSILSDKIKNYLNTMSSFKQQEHFLQRI